MELKSNWVIATDQKQCQIGYSFYLSIYGIVKLAIQTASKNSNGVSLIYCHLFKFILFFFFLWNSQIGYSNSCKIQKFKWS
jgi:hypothetical protein